MYDSEYSRTLSGPVLGLAVAEVRETRFAALEEAAARHPGAAGGKAPGC
jgi:hypothetical protein